MKTQLQKIKFIVSLFVLIISTVSFAQQGINYQGVARNAEGDLMTSTDITLDIIINKTSEDGETVYSETHDLTTDVNGVFSLVISQGTPDSNVFEDINWAEDVHYLMVKLNGTNIGATKFEGVPYTQAIGKFQAHKNGLTTKGTGGSIYIGDNAGVFDDFTDNHNIGLGENTLQATTEGWANIALGKDALIINRSGHNNVALGQESLSRNTTGHSNIALGFHSLFNNNGQDNIALGWQSLLTNSEGENNIALGEDALLSNSIGNYNIALGKNALYNNTTADGNIAIGTDALLANTTGFANISIGNGTLSNNENGLSNIAIGREALNLNNESFNVVIGTSSLKLNVGGSKNVALGDFIMVESISGERNTIIGHAAGRNTLGNGNVFLGNNAGFFETGSNKLYISNNNSNGGQLPLIYGEFDNDILGFDAKVGIGTTSPSASLHIAQGDDVTLALGSGYIILGDELQGNLALDSNEIQAREGGLATDLELQALGGNLIVGGAIVHASDRRLKRDIKDISYGLKEILELRPTEYFWKSKEQEHKSLGLIAQEVDLIIKNVVTYNKTQDKYGVSYTELIPVLIKALQEQQDIINNQNKTIESFEDRLQALETNNLSSIIN